MSGPYSGVRIVDLSSMLSGPLCAAILGDQGADVIKVERPGAGDHVRSLGHRSAGLSAQFLHVNRNKRSISVDLQSERGREVTLDLIRTADVVVQNMRPGVVERLGVGYEDAARVKPDIVYLSLSGFGEKGPWRDKPTYDPVIQAVTGLTTIQAGSDAERPRLVRTILPDKHTALCAAQAVGAALYHRLRTGEGQHVRLSMMDAVLSFLWASDFNAQTFPEKEVSNQRAASFIDLIYETADGYMTVATMHDRDWRRFCTAMEREDLLADERFATPALRDQNVNDRLALIQECLIGRTTAENTALLEAHQVPCAPALTRSEVVGHPQVAAMESLVEVAHPVAGRLRQARGAARFEASPQSLRRGAPLLGEHCRELLEEAGYGAEQIEALREAGVVGFENDPGMAARAAE